MFAFVCSALVVLGAAADDPAGSLNDHLIWLSSAPAGTQVYAAFRKSFELEEAPLGASYLSIFADSRYTLWINGQYVQRGPCRFDPKSPDYDVIDVAGFLKKGPNIISVLVHHYHDGKEKDNGDSMNGRIMRHEPGLAARLAWVDAMGKRCFLLTDNTWRGTTKTRFKPSPCNWGGIPDDIDARLDSGDWTLAEFDDSAWETPVAVDGALWGKLNMRRVPLLRETEITPARTPQLPVTLKAGEEALIDVGQVVLAYDVLDLEAQEGTSIEVAHGLTRSDKELSDVSMTNKYVAKAGRQTYMSGDTTGFRHMGVKVVSGQMTLLGVKVVNRVYPFDCVASFKSNDEALNALWERSVRTVQLCSEDGYVDCADRERVEWMGDGALVEYPMTRVAFGPGPGDGRLIKNMLRHIAQSQQPDGRLKAHHPSTRWDIHGYIEDYTCLWVQTLRLYYEDNPWDLDLVKELWPAVVGQMQWFLDHRSENGLVHAREFIFFDNPLAYKVCDGTTLNACVVGALRNSAALAQLVGADELREKYEKAADELQGRINEELWDEATGTYHGGILDGKKTEPTAHAAMVALYYDVVPQAQRERVLSWLVDHRSQLGSPFVHHFFFKDLFEAGNPDLDKVALDTMRERWASTLARTELDTVFEGFGGGSLCHNMGAAPAPFLLTHVLGVRLEGQKVVIEPHLGDLTDAEGTVVAGTGLISVKWNQSGDSSLKFTIDKSAGPWQPMLLRLPIKGSKPMLTINGAAREDARVDGAYLAVEINVPSGKVEGTLKD